MFKVMNICFNDKKKEEEKPSHSFISIKTTKHNNKQNIAIPVQVFIFY